MWCILFTDFSSIKLEINTRNIHRKYTNIWNLNNKPLNNLCSKNKKKKEITGELENILN